MSVHYSWILNAPSGRGHHKRWKKGARSKFDRRMLNVANKKMERELSFSWLLCQDYHRESLQPLNLETSCEWHASSKLCVWEFEAQLSGRLFQTPCGILSAEGQSKRCASCCCQRCCMRWPFMKCFFFFRRGKVPIARKVLADFPPGNWSYQCSLKASGVLYKLSFAQAILKRNLLLSARKGEA